MKTSTPTPRPNRIAFSPSRIRSAALWSWFTSLPTNKSRPRNFAGQSTDTALILTFMKRIKKIFLTVALSLLVLLILGVLLVAWRLDDVVKRAVETVGPQITKTSVNLDSIHIGLMTGSAKVKGFILGNPEGFASSNAMSVGVAEVGVNPFSVLSKKIVIRTIHVEAPEITFEGNPFSGNNFSKLLDNVNGTAKAGGPPMTNTTAKAASKPAPKIEVDEFFITGARVHIVATG